MGRDVKSASYYHAVLLYAFDMSELPQQHFLDLRDRINVCLEKTQALYRQDQIEKFPWLYGALGAVPSDTMFICENPSVAGIQKANVQTIDGGKPDIEAQWWGGPNDYAAKRFRHVLFELGLKTSPPDCRGGWNCYITNVVKEANFTKEQRKFSGTELKQQAKKWADILLWEIEVVNPQHIFAIGGAAYKRVRELSLFPADRIHRIWHYSARRSDDVVITKMKREIEKILMR